MEAEAPTGGESAQEILQQLLAGITTLERALLEARLAAQKYERDAESLRQEMAAHTNSHRKLQQDYETLRIQKGGFGLKMLALSGFAGFVFGLAFFWLFLLLQPKETHAVAFDRFREENLFNFEYAIHDGRIDDVENALRIHAEKPENAVIQPELDFSRKLLSAAKRRCEEEKK